MWRSVISRLTPPSHAHARRLRRLWPTSMTCCRSLHTCRRSLSNNKHNDVQDSDWIKNLKQSHVKNRKCSADLLAFVF